MPYIKYIDLPSKSTDSETYFKEWTEHFKNQKSFKVNKIVICRVQPNASGWCIGYTGMDDYSYISFISQLHSGKNLYRFGYENNKWFFNQI